jgi:type 2 lantibiotic biosynthesis protein LanM
MVYKSLRLIERLNLHRAFDEIKVDQTALNRVEKWKTQAPFDEHPEWFTERLSLDGIDVAKLAALLSEPAGFSRDGASSREVTWMNALVDIYKRHGGELLSATVLKHLQETEPNAGFVNLVIPLLNHVQDQLKQIQVRAGRRIGGQFIPASMIDEMVADLARRLVNRLGRTMILEVRVSNIRGELKRETSEQRYNYFCEELRTEETFQYFIQEYPVLFRQLNTIVEDRLVFLEEFCNNLAQDWETLWLTFFPDSPKSPLERLEFTGDSHRGGRRVTVLTFASGQKLVYKPRSLEIDGHFYALLEWINKKGLENPFRLIKTIDLGTHGWVEFVKNQECRSEEEVRRFFQRAGGLLALFYLLWGTDLHFENVLSSGEHPILVDLECLFQPFQSESMTEEAEQIAKRILRASVLRAGMIPERIWFDEPHQNVDLSALGARPNQLEAYPHPVVENSGTDQVKLIRKRLPMNGSVEQAQPRLHGKLAEVSDYRAFFIAGFSQVYNLLLANREELSLPEGPLAAFDGDTIRIVPRATVTYMSFLMESYHPDLLKDALARDQFFDRLWIPFEDFGKSPGLIFRSEQSELWRDDVPYFWTRTNSRDLVCGDGSIIKDHFHVAGLDLVFQRINSFSPEDLYKQLGFIEASMAALVPNETGIQSNQDRNALSRSWKRSTRHAPCRERASLKADLVSEAMKIGDRLLETAFYGQGDVSWLDKITVGEYSTLSTIGVDLYSGLAGIALFVAHLGILSGEKKYTNLAERTVLGMQKQLRKKLKPGFEIGLFSGIGGSIYTFSHLALLWGDDSLLDNAKEVVQILLPVIAQGKGIQDVIAGHAGLVRAALWLYELCGDPASLELAIQCGEVLASTAVVQAAGLAWNMPMNEKNYPLTGFGHGTGGIVWALLKLADVTGRNDFRQLAMHGLDYERSQFSAQDGNWKDLREVKQPMRRGLHHLDDSHFMTAWCHGAAGIGLARLDTLASGDALFAEEVQVAIQTTITNLFDNNNNSLCHGDLGNLELLLFASQKLQDVSLEGTVYSAAEKILGDMRRNGWQTGLPSGVETFGLMIGISGIGYELLRLAEPDLVPSVLILQMPQAKPHPPM